MNDGFRRLNGLMSLAHTCSYYIQLKSLRQIRSKMDEDLCKTLLLIYVKYFYV
jgi:hypothetical protein